MILIFLLLAIRLNVKMPSIAMERRMLEATMESEHFKNVWQETSTIPKIAFLTPNSIANYVLNFSKYSKRLLSQVGLSYELLHVACVANSTTSKLKVYVLNFLGRRANITVKVDGNSNNSLVENEAIWTSIFDYTPGSKYTIIVETLNYNESFPFQTSSKDSFAFFFDFKSTSKDGDVYRKIVNYTLERV